VRVSRGPHRAGTVSGAVAAARRMEGRRLQRRVRRHVQRAAEVARAALRLAPAGLLPQVTGHGMIRFAKAHAYGNDFVYVEQAAVAGADLPALTRRICERNTGVGADGLIVYERTGRGATMRLFNADGGRAEVSGNGVRALAALLLQGSEPVNSAVTIETEGGVKQAVRLERA